MRLPAVPALENDNVRSWAIKIIYFLRTIARELETPGPKIIQLEHKMEDVSAMTDGLLMYDPVAETVVLSKNGAWYPLTVGATPVNTGITNNRGRRSTKPGWPTL